MRNHHGFQDLPAELRRLNLRLVGAARFGRPMPPRRKNPTLPGYEDVVDQPLYDSFTVQQGANFPTVTTLFQSPIGANGKTLAQTNMTLNGQLPAPQRAYILSYRIFVRNDAVPADLMLFGVNASHSWMIGTKPYWQGPSFLLSAGTGMIVTAAAQVGTAPAGSAPLFTTSQGVPDQRSVYALTQPYILEQGETFNWTVRAETAFALTANTANPAGTGLTIYIVLDTQLYRGVQ